MKDSFFIIIVVTSSVAPSTFGSMSLTPEDMIVWILFSYITAVVKVEPTDYSLHIIIHSLLLSVQPCLVGAVKGI